MSFGLPGATSLMVIFGVLCLAVFAVLTLSTVLADSRLKAASDESVLAVCRADAAAEEQLAELRLEGKDGLREFSVPVTDTRYLNVRVRISGETVEILRWQLTDSAEWQADESLQVWSGE